jgi:hypothetical protein
VGQRRQQLDCLRHRGGDLLGVVDHEGDVGKCVAEQSVQPVGGLPAAQRHLVVDGVLAAAGDRVE